MAAATPKAEADKSEGSAPAVPEGSNQSNLPVDQRPPGDIRRRRTGPKRKGPFVKYVGSAALRRITPTQWKSLGKNFADVKDETVWSVKNDKMVEAEDLSDYQLDHLLIDELQQGTNTHAFLLVDFDDKGQLVQVAYE